MRIPLLVLVLIAAAGAVLSVGKVLSAESRSDAGARIAQGEKPPHVRLLVPAYFYPADAGSKDWNRLITAAAQIPIVAIVNPASGPGKDADANYVKVLQQAKKAKKLTLIGYITTSHGKRPLADVQADVDQWLRLYPVIDGIFFDEQASGADHVDYQATLYQYVRTKKGLKLVVTNPGTICAEAYLSRPATDVACLFENPKAFDPSTFPAWVAKYSPDHIAALSYQIGTVEAMRQCIQLAAHKKIGYCYVTDAGGANPWSRLPHYWDEEVAAAAKANQHAQP
jgi:hypothetical protein